jgi:AcrR family transcriptional regulator
MAGVKKGSHKLGTSRDAQTQRQMNIAATRAAVLAAARRQFARVGYSEAELGKIAADARVTTGAIYHHFGSKKGLFLAVAERLEADILQEGLGAPGADPWERFRAGFEKLVDFCASADVQRIIFVEAPQVMGPEGWRKIELKYAYGALHETLPKMIKAEILKPLPVELLARILLALLRETSAEVARTKGDAKARAQVSDLLAGVLGALAAR